MADTSPDPLKLEAYRVAREAFHLELTRFWQRSNYFLVLSTAIAAGFFSLRDPRYTLPLAVFGLVVALLWLAVNLGSKFWLTRWEYRLCVTEKDLRSGMDLFSASWGTMQNDVRLGLGFRRRGAIHRAYTRLVLLKPSVTLMMTVLSLAFVGLWIAMLFVAVG